ncbi:MAG: 8-amino-7-oxononanoate synthase [Phycisphaerales bacterium]|nr:8-amino-7-oxononanoate synthase [Phycisphaerales bacterium]
MNSPLDAAVAAALEGRDRAGLLRRRTAWRPTGPVTVERDGREFVNFASNNYLGFTHHPRLLAALRTAVNVGSGAAGLISGHSAVHATAEQAIAEWKSCEAAILLPSGYQANLAVVQTLGAIANNGIEKGGVRFLIDKLAHASLLDAVRLGGHAFRIFPHNGLAKLERLLADAPKEQLQVILTESIFSMDGDAGDLVGLAELKRRHPFVLVVDEAHGSGIYGRHGAGLIDELGVREAVDVTVITLSKALGLAGAAVCGSAGFIQSVENFGRAYIYSTAVPPLTAELATEAVAVCREEPQHRHRVRMLAKRVRGELAAVGLIKFTDQSADSPIIPIVLGEPARALAAAESLRDEGLLVVAVRPPTVPPGTSRLRVTVSAAHTDEQIKQLIAALSLVPSPGTPGEG